MTNRILLIGYGNPSRLDDGLGPLFAEAIEALALPGVSVEVDYQLSVETAELLKDHDVVIFADASISGPEPFAFTKLKGSLAPSFTTHSLKPEDVLALAQSLFTAPPAYVLALRGYVFNDFGEILSEKARQNLQAALAFMRELIQQGDFAEKASPAFNPSEN